MCGGAPGSVPCPIAVVSWLLVVCLRVLTYSLRNALLAVSHEQIGDLVDYGVVAVLDVTVLGQRQRGHLKLQSWHRRCFGHRLEVYEAHVDTAVST
jgi:hypothetical protein